MTSIMASNRVKPLQCSKPLSSAYLVMLKRHLERLHEQHPQKNELCQVDSNKDLQGQLIAIEQISPLIREIERLSGYGNFGLDIGKYMHPSDYGIFGYAMMNCETLMCALRSACEHKNMFNLAFNSEFVIQNNIVIYKVSSVLPLKECQVLVELDFSTAFEFAQRLAGPYKDELKISSVSFTHQPLGPVEHYLTRFKCPVYFGAQESQIIIEKKVLDTRIYGANPKVLSVFEDKISHLFRSANETSTLFKDQVFRYVKEHLGGELPSAQTAAQHFYMSLSAFKKRLHLEHSCYQVICDEVRYQHCRVLMQRGGMAIKEIAFELGFANASAFNRAFKRWSGVSPSCFKRRSHEQMTDMLMTDIGRNLSN